MARRRTSPVVLTAIWTTRKWSTATPARGSGTWGTRSVYVFLGLLSSAHRVRRLTGQKSVSCPRARTSRGLAVTYW